MRRIPLVINQRQDFSTSGPHGSPTGGSLPGTTVTSLTVQFRDTSTNNPTTWEWTFERQDGVVVGTSTQQNPSFTFPAAGTYTVTLLTDVGTISYTVTVVGTVPSGGGGGGPGGGNGGGGGGGGGGGIPFGDPPNAAAIAGLSLTQDWDWTGLNPLAGWYLYDGSGNANSERSLPRASNAEVLTEAGTTSGDVFLRLWCKRENYLGSTYTGVQMENAGGIRVGNGGTFYVEVRLRWVGYLGFWGGPWLLQFPGTPHEIDVMETVNFRPPWTTSHNPSIATQAYAATNDGAWHRYGIRVESSGLTWYYDNTEVLSLANGTIGAQFVNATMFAKIQHLCGGTFPDGDSGQFTPDDSAPFPDRPFDIDYYRIYT